MVDKEHIPRFLTYKLGWVVTMAQLVNCEIFHVNLYQLELN
jgi:hypothetical protein